MFHRTLSRKTLDRLVLAYVAIFLRHSVALFASADSVTHPRQQSPIPPSQTPSHPRNGDRRGGWTVPAFCGNGAGGSAGGGATAGRGVRGLAWIAR